jgi:putative tryptophan/tyrosine transport system substrate-binding protein
MRRREFIGLLGGAAVAWPLTARAQQGERVRRIAVLMPYRENDPDVKGWLSGFTQGLSELGWTDGRNLRMDVRWAADNIDQMRIFAKELVGLQPDVIVSISTPATAAVQRETQTIPIVFTALANPVGDGFVASLSRPGGNITGFTTQEPAIAGRWLQMLTEIAPRVTRAAAMVNPETSPGGGSYFVAEFEAAARSLKVAPVIAVVHSDVDIEAVIAGLGREPGGGLVVTPSVFAINHRASIISLALRHNVPAVYRDVVDVKDGGLLSYGPDVGDIVRRAAPYVDRILRGAKPADLSVQLPIKFQMAINLKTAKALGLAIPESFLLRADEVIE